MYVVTGGAGFIGSHLVERLLSMEEKVVVIDNLHLGVRRNIPKGIHKFVEGPSSKIKEIDGPEDIEAIFHLGIYSSSPMYKQDPQLLSRAISDHIEILEFCRKNDIKLIHSSTSSIYNGNPPPHREDMKIIPSDLYSEMRYYAERTSAVYSKIYGVETVALRYFSVYGPREEHKGKYANLVSQIIWKILRDERPILFGDGSQTRDFTYVSDVVNANIKGLQKDLTGTFNVGTGEAHSFNDLVKIINEELGKNITPIYVENPIKNYVMHTLADTTRSEEVLKFRAKVNLEEGIKKLIEYYKGVGINRLPKVK